MKIILTLPAVIADTQLLPSEIAVAVVGAAAVVPAVGDVTGLTFPVLVTFTVHSAGSRVPRCTFPMARAVIRTRVHPGQKGTFIQPTVKKTVKTRKLLSKSLVINSSCCCRFQVLQKSTCTSFVDEMLDKTSLPSINS